MPPKVAALDMTGISVKILSVLIRNAVFSFLFRSMVICQIGALPPPAHHSSGRTVLAAPPAHPLPAHLQPTALFPAHPQVGGPYTAAYTALSPAKSQYQIM
ncbi:hypothetical protein Avbf_01982 [Armadillidium vulgare]|nr:hypothetical protein Avbf_01982 [Armadillidium vulgare]